MATFEPLMPLLEFSPAGLHGNGAQEVDPYRLLEPVVRRDVDAAGFAAAIVGMDPHDARNVQHVGTVGLFHIGTRCRENAEGL